MNSVAVIDYGMGNLRSVAKALEHVSPQASVLVTSDPERILAADRVVFPGQGAIGDAMAQLTRFKLEPVLRQALQEKPFLGICLGLQALMERSEEDGGVDGFAVFPGQVRRFPSQMVDRAAGTKLKVPHMGWNEVRQTRDHPLWQGIEQEARFYFVHSFYVELTDRSITAATSYYGLDFVCAAASGNVFAVQFHPEKSQRAGLRLLENFMAWDGRQ